MQNRVRDNPDRSRYEVWAGDELAGFGVYRLRDDRITFVHTEIEPAYEGQGLGSVLARHALDATRERGLAVLPVCPFFAGYIRRHPEYADLVPAPRRADYGLDP
ncbi:MAG: GNAT family N-acetyltransferase [Propionibacteriales bacterium]|nr:GNAT family N-acetyltransferase [Propionibacteriales bacterium]